MGEPTRDSEYRKELYEARQVKDLPLAEKLEQFLSIGRKYLDVENGHLKLVDHARGRHHVVASVGGPAAFIEIGDVHDHASTFCRLAMDLDVPLSVTHAEEQGWADDPAYHAHDLECYLGTSVTVDGELFGSLCFVSRAARSREFSASERAFVELLASIIGTELSATGYAKRLSNRDKLLAVQNRVLRHNLRNDMNIVQGYATLLAERTEGENHRFASYIEKRAQHLCRLGEKARDLESLVVRNDTLPESVDVVPVLHDVVARLEAQVPDATVSVTAPEELTCVASGQLSRALYELGSNAVLHSGPEPSVELIAHPADDEWCRITVSDDGPGLAKVEQQILQGEMETQLSHGQGLGLWIAYWIVERVGGSISVDTTEGTSVTVRLHHARMGDESDWARRLVLELIR